MKDPRNEREFNTTAAPAERCAVKFRGAMHPSLFVKRRRLSLWQRFLNHPIFNIRWIP